MLAGWMAGARGAGGERGRAQGGAPRRTLLGEEGGGGIEGLGGLCGLGEEGAV